MTNSVHPAFILPCEPTLRDRLPKGEGWLYEVKFDGYRMQVHKAGGHITLFTRNGADWTERFPHLIGRASSALIFSTRVHHLDASPGGSQQNRAPMCVLAGPGVAHLELLPDTGDLFVRRHSFSDWWTNFIFLVRWSLFVLLADERLGRRYGRQAEHRRVHELIHVRLRR